MCTPCSRLRVRPLLRGICHSPSAPLFPLPRNPLGPLRSQPRSRMPRGGVRAARGRGAASPSGGEWGPAEGPPGGAGGRGPRERRGRPAHALQTAGRERNERGRPGPQPSGAAGAPSPRGPAKVGGRQTALLLPPSAGGCAAACAIRRDPHTRQEGPIKLSKAPPLQIRYVFFSGLKEKKNYLNQRVRRATQPRCIGADR